MQKLYFILILFIGFSYSSYGQLTEIKVKITDNLQKYNDPRLNKKSATKPKTCGKDTVEYARRKATAYNSISIRKNYSLGQIFGAPQDITVHGFTFFAWAVANPPTSKKIRLICNLYKAGTDSLPTGSPLASDTVTVDSTFGKGVLTVLEKRARFKKPVTVNFPYILTVESDSANLSAGLVANSWPNKDGDSANLLCGSISGKWYRGLSLNISGVSLNADMQFYPYVSYKFGTDFKVPVCFDFKDSARFKNSSPNNVAGSKFYSLYSFYDIEQYIHQWNYGEVPWNFNGIDGINYYGGVGNYKVRLITYLYQWRGNSPCLDTTEKIMYFKPKNPKVIGSSNICRGDVANIQVFSDTGTVIKWYKNVTGSPVNTGQNYNLGKIQKNDTFYVKAYNYSCESNFTQIIVTVNDYPKHPVIKDDSICFGAKANLEAVSSLGKSDWHTDTMFLPFYSGNVLQTGALNKNVSYYVRSNNNGCYSPYFKMVTAYVDNSFAPDEPIVSKDTTICFRPLGNAMLRAKSIDNDSIRWFLVPSGGTSVGRGNTFKYVPSTVGTTTIYVEAQKTTCASSRLGINIIVSDYPAISQVFNDEKCKGDTAQIGGILTASGNIFWYENATGGSSIANGSVIKHFTLTSKNLYGQAESNGCVNPSRVAANIKINAYDSITKIDVPIVCGNAKVTLKVTAGSNVIKWYEDIEATKLLATSATYTTPTLLVSTNYYFTVEKNGCKSQVNNVLAEVIPLPVAGYNYSFIAGHKISLVPTITDGVTYLWKMGDGNSYTSKFVTHKYVVYGTYNIKLIVKSITSGCKDSTSQDILFDFSGVKPIVPNSFISISPNPTTKNFKLKISPEFASGKLTIISLDGKVVMVKNLNGSGEEEIFESFIPGLYTIKIDANQKLAIAKLIIQ